MIDSTTLSAFLDEVAARRPAPGGGAVAAFSGSLASAMAQMVAVYSISSKTDETIHQQVTDTAHRLRSADLMMRELVKADGEAYQAMVAARKRAREDNSNSNAYQDSIVCAIGVPMQIAALATDALKAMDDFKSVANEYLLSDLGVAAVLAEATVRAAAYSVRVNISELADESRRETVEQEIAQISLHAQRLRDSIEASLSNKLA